MQWKLERELFSACEKGDLDIVRRLSGEVAVSNVRNWEGQSPLHFAAMSVYNTLLRLKIANNCIFNTQVIKI